jgi:hypothetical protein
MKKEDIGNDGMALLESSIKQCLLSQAGFACWVDAYEQPVILNGKFFQFTGIRDGKSWIHLKFENEAGYKLGMRTDTVQHRTNLINWANNADAVFSVRRDCVGLTGPGNVRFTKTEGNFSCFLLPEPMPATVFRQRRMERAKRI